MFMMLSFVLCWGGVGAGEGLGEVARREERLGAGWGCMGLVVEVRSGIDPIAVVR